MEWSRYQTAIFDFFQNSNRNLFINAVAGSGKTTVLVEIGKLIPAGLRKTAIFVAFNTEIAKTLGTKLPAGFESSTIHSVAYKVCQKLLGMRKLEVRFDKYKSLTLTSIENRLGDKTKSWPHVEPIVDLIEKSMLNLADYNDNEILVKLADRHNIEILDWKLAMQVIPEIINNGLSMVKRSITFTEMAYLAVHKPSAVIPQYKIVMVDEAQDLNPLLRELILRIGGKNQARFIFVGDPRQSIYGFAGADIESVKKIIEVTNAVEMPLSVSYRCPKTHVDLAKAIVPNIEASDNAIDGCVLDIKKNEVGDLAIIGDMIICRMTAPLVKLALKLIAQGKPARVLGREIGKSLTKIVTTVESIQGYSWNKFAEYLEVYKDNSLSALEGRKDAEKMAAGLNDRIESVFAIYETQKALGIVNSATDLRNYIDGLFVEKGKFIKLCTCHRAKGLEAKNVFILRPDLLPFITRKTLEWEKEQEYNLWYVSLTRSLENLYMIIEDEK